MALTRQELERLYGEIEVSLYNYALRWVWNPRTAEDLVHDAFVRVWSARASVRPETLKALVYKALHNLCLNEVRKRRLREVVPFLDLFSSGEGEEEFVRRNDLRELKNALEALPGDLRVVLLMTEFSDLSYDEVARLLRIPPGTVASRKSRAIEALRTHFKEKSNV